MTGASTREAVLIIRVWFEGEPPSELRARILEVVDAPTDEQTVATVASAEDLYEAVRSWIGGLTPQ